MKWNKNCCVFFSRVWTSSTPNRSSHFYPTTGASMPKKSSGRKKGIQRGIPRHRVRERVEEQAVDNHERKETGFLCFHQSKLSSVGDKCFQILLASCEKLYLLGFTSTQNGEYVPVCRKDQIRHYAAISFCLALCMQKTWGTAQVLLYEELRMESFMCISVALVYNSAVLLGLGVVMRPKETMDLHNSWAHASASLKKIDPNSKFRPFDNISACLRLILTFLVTQGIPFAVALLSVIMSDLPIFWFPMAKSFGMLPERTLPKWTWQIIFPPLEWLMAQPFMLMASFSADLLFMEVGLLEIYMRQLQNLNARCLQSRKRVEQMYRQLELFNRIGQVWIRFFFPPWLVAVSASVIVTMFVTIRYTELPLIFYVFYPYTAVTLMILIFWQSYDMFRTIRGSEDILVGLWQQEAPYFQGMTRAKRIEKIKRSKSMRPLIFSLADSEFSLNLPINTWDEIINQILFLLSL